MRIKLLIGTLILIAGLVVYAGLVMAVAHALLPDNAAVAFGYYLVAGVAWLWPAARLTRWMQDLPPWQPKL